jgi:3,4-dihydroxy 2-butanone 4-phosphate synthase/GTP cyclohydrolase II
MAFSSVEEAINQFRTGLPVIIVDDEGRENEGDFVFAADKITPEAVNFLLKNARGLVCLAIEGKRLDELQIEPMVKFPSDRYESNFTVSIDARFLTSTGISAQDRAATIQAVLDPTSGPGDFAKPGHVFPLRAAPGGVLQRAGHTEASVDLARLSGLFPAAVICEILSEEGTSARLPELEALADRFGCCVVTLEQMIKHRSRTEKLVRKIATAFLPTHLGDFNSISYESLVDGKPYIALVKGEVAGKEDVLVRMHSGCLTGEALRSLRCDCGEQLDAAMRIIQEEGRGVIVYIHHHEGRGIGLFYKHLAYQLQDEGIDTVEANEQLGFPADLRDYGIGAQVLVDLGLTSIRLLTNNPKKVVALEGHGLRVAEQVPLTVTPNPHNLKYLRTKQEKLGHKLDL